MKSLIFLLACILVSFTAIAQTNGEIGETELETLQNSFDYNEASNKALLNAISANDINKLAINRDVTGKTEHHFKYKVKVKGITNQESSGRCWMYAGLNSLRPVIIENKNLSSFEFSTNYLFFYDQLEKANLFLESIINTCDQPIDSRKVEWLLKHPISDGGVWNSFANLVDKYGAVPARIMPETYHSENTRVMSRILSTKLRQQAIELRDMAKGRKSDDVLHSAKLEMLKDIYRILVLSLGQPPQEFSYRFINSDNEASEIQNYTPQSFFKAIFPNYNVNDYVMLMNDPTREYYKMYEIEMDRNVMEGRNWIYLNLPNDEIKGFSLASIKDNEAMYASCDVGKFKLKEDGTLDISNYDYESLFGVEFNMNKSERIKSFNSGSSHAMLLMAADTDEKDNVTMWQFENSWGASYGHKGYLTFTDEWFNEYMFRVVINKKYLDSKTLKLLDQEPIVLPPWDPMFQMDE